MKKHALALGFLATAGFSAPLLADEANLDIHVYKSPTCGCCEGWVDHMKDNGFNVEVTDTNNLNPIKAEAGLTPALASCHTAFIGDYVIEGHVPARDIRRLIAESPQARGLSAPGMPVGSPGMEMGNRKDHYKIMLFNSAGQSRVFSEYN